MFRVIIAGGRDFDNYELLKQKMDFLLSETAKPIQVVCGQARGADQLGQLYAKERGLKIRYYPANWDYYGKAAGPIRNEEMAQNADALVAFWDGESRGTKNMIENAKKYKLKIRIIKYGRKAMPC